MARNARSHGFTLVETMVVVVMLGLLLVVAIPNFANSNRRRRAEAAAEEISTTLQIARQRAIATRVPFRVVFDETEETYWSERSANDSTWVRDPDEVHTLPTGVDWSPRAGGDLSNADVEFESRGTVLTADAPFVVNFTNAQGDTFHLSLVRTGRLTVRGGAR
jgi:type IV fimbrial biogenesis protein FimT